MRLTTFTDYALRTLLFVATAPERRATIAGIAAAYGISQNHLVKVAHLLGKEGFLANTRGRHGGLRLAVAPAMIGLGRVVRATEGPSIPAECFDPAGCDCPIVHSCRLKHILGDADAAFYASLDRYSLQDLLASPARLSSILHHTRIVNTGDCLQ